MENNELKINIIGKMIFISTSHHNSQKNKFQKQ